MKHKLPRANGDGGFTLLEVVGVLAILAVLGWAVLEGVWTHLKESIRTDESARLEEIGRSLRRAVAHQRGIPAATNWPEWVAVETAEPATTVLRNAAGWNRRLVMDPDCRVGTPALAPPYRQGVAGSTQPTAVRAVLLSTVAADFPSLTSVRFSDLWERVPGHLPRNWSSRWAGKPEDLLLERVGFENLFRRVCLNHLDGGPSAWVAVDGVSNRLEILSGSKLETFYLEGTELIFLDARGEIQWAGSVESDASYAYEGGRWRCGIGSGPTSAQRDIATTFEAFVQSPSTEWGSTPVHAAAAMQEWVASYVAWAEEGFPRVSPIPGRSVPAWTRVEAATSRLEAATGLLLGMPPWDQP